MVSWERWSSAWLVSAPGSQIVLLALCSTVRSWKRSRTVTVETLRTREPGEQWPFNREQLATVLDANARETSTILATPTKKAKPDGADTSTLPVLRKSLSSGSKEALLRSVEELRHMP